MSTQWEYTKFWYAKLKGNAMAMILKSWVSDWLNVIILILPKVHYMVDIISLPSTTTTIIL